MFRLTNECSRLQPNGKSRLYEQTDYRALILVSVSIADGSSETFGLYRSEGGDGCMVLER